MKQQDEQTFPTYAQWLSAHPDTAIAALLHRLVKAGSADLIDNLTGTLPAHTRRILHKQPESSAALIHLSAIELAVLHAASEVDAAHHPVSEEEIWETLGELFDIAGTTPDQRPTRSAVRDAMRSLTQWGLMFGPGVRLANPGEQPTAPSGSVKVPPRLPHLFQPTTPHLWRLVDATRCPIPTAHIATAVEELPPRQRRLLTTLLSAGGVGHSASLHPDAEPSAPLPTLVRHGILDQLDDHTARLSGRIQQHLGGTLVAPPGGSYRQVPPATTPSDSSATTAQMERATAAGTATAIQLIQELGDSLRDLIDHPLTPLTSGGLGIRELTKVSRRRALDTSAVMDQLTWMVHANVAALGSTEPTERIGLRSELWTGTVHATDFLDSSPARAWAWLLLGWSSSPYSPWAGDETVRPFSPELFLPQSSDLRAAIVRILATYFSPTNEAGGCPTPQHVRDALWRQSPGLAWSTPQVAWEHVWEEAARVGLVATLGQRASRNESSFLPDSPVATLAATALAETLDLVDADSCPDPVSDLAARLDRVLPDPVDTLIIQADHTIMAPGLLSADDAAVLASIADQESAGMASVWRVSKESVVRGLSSGLSADAMNVFLRSRAMGGPSGVPQSLSYLIDDAQRALDDGAVSSSPNASRNAAIVLDAPRRSWEASDPETVAELDRTIDAAIEAFRRSSADLNGAGEGTGDTHVATDLQGMMAALKQAYASGTIVEVAYADRQGEPIHDRVSVIMMSPSVIAVVSEISGDSVTLQPHRLTSVKSA